MKSTVSTVVSVLCLLGGSGCAGESPQEGNSAECSTGGGGHGSSSQTSPGSSAESMAGSSSSGSVSSAVSAGSSEASSRTMGGSSSQVSSSAMPASSEAASSSAGTSSSGSASPPACPAEEASLPPLQASPANSAAVLNGDAVGLNRAELGCLRRVIPVQLTNADGRFEAGPLWMIAGGGLSQNVLVQEFRNIDTQVVCGVRPDITLYSYEGTPIGWPLGRLWARVGTSAQRAPIACLAPGESGVVATSVDLDLYIRVARAVMDMPLGVAGSTEPASRIVAQSYQDVAAGPQIQVTFRNLGTSTADLQGALIIYLDDGGHPLGVENLLDGAVVAANREVTLTGNLYFKRLSQRLLVLTTFRDQ